MSVAYDDLLGMNMPGLADICLSKVTLAINLAGAATIKTTGTTTYLLGGKCLTKAALAAQALTALTGTTFYVQPASSTVFYNILLDAAGSVFTQQGTYTGQVFPVGSVAKGDSLMPMPPLGYVLIGAIKIVSNGSTTFTPGTTALDAAGLTVTYLDCTHLPAGRTF